VLQYRAAIHFLPLAVHEEAVMKLKRAYLCIILLATLMILLGAGSYIGKADSPGYTLNWWTVDNGGIMNLTSGSYALGGTIGQPDAGILQGGGYTLNGGFWVGNLPTRQQIFLPVINR
jgi:hypothetical protein